MTGRGRAGAFFGPRRRRLWAMAGRHGLFMLTPAILSAFLVAEAVGRHDFAVDFNHTAWVAGGRLLHGGSPYVGPHSVDVTRGDAFTYPALFAVLALPFSLLPRAMGSIVFTLLCVASVVLALRLCGVRDQRIYGLAFLWPAVISGWQTANVTLLLVLGVAGTWRYRDRPVVAGTAVALLVSLKLFLWPLGIWLLATRRYRAAGWAAGLGATLSLIAWAAVGFGQIARYVRLLTAVTRAKARDGYSLLALAPANAHLIAYVATAVVAFGGLAAAVALARRGEERSSFVLCTAACLLVTPLVWLHYFALLLVPLALSRPRLAPLWFLPALLWFPVIAPQRWQVGVVLAIAAVVAIGSTRRVSPAHQDSVSDPQTVGDAGEGLMHADIRPTPIFER